MSTSWHEEIERAYAELEQSQRAIGQVQRDLSGVRVTRMSRNRAVSVVVDVQGELLDITFHSRSYRSMPAAELSALLVQTVGEARQEAVAELASMYAAVLPSALPIMEMMNGSVDIDEMMSEALRQVPDRPGRSHHAER